MTLVYIFKNYSIQASRLKVLWAINENTIQDQLLQTAGSPNAQTTIPPGSLWLIIEDMTHMQERKETCYDHVLMYSRSARPSPSNPLLHGDDLLQQVGWEEAQLASGADLQVSTLLFSLLHHDLKRTGNLSSDSDFIQTRPVSQPHNHTTSQGKKR